LRRASPGKKQDRGSLVFLVAGYWLALLLAFGIAFTATFAAMSSHRFAIFYVGAGMIIVGVLVRQYAIVTLGLLHTLDVTTRPAQPVVEGGPYRWVRHPSYAGAMLTGAGILLCSTNWLSLACYALVVATYAYRIRVEESALTADLGEPYRAYMRRTKRLIPYLI
jgi:protein-S-isoprenylcysteine O-methyltransferase Ste14